VRFTYKHILICIQICIITDTHTPGKSPLIPGTGALPVIGEENDLDKSMHTKVLDQLSEGEVSEKNRLASDNKPNTSDSNTTAILSKPAETAKTSSVSASSAPSVTTISSDVNTRR
jgi:hypothetical protein